MTSEEIHGALEDFLIEASGSQQDVSVNNSSALKFEEIAASPIADSQAEPGVQGDSLSMDTLKNEVSEREQAEDLLRAVRKREPATRATNSDAVRVAPSRNLSDLPKGVAVRVYRSESQHSSDIPGPRSQVQIIDPSTRKVVLSQG